MLFATITRKIGLGKNYQGILNLETENLHNLKLFPHRFLISCKGKNSYNIVEKLDNTMTW